jgi:hypothetical protein
VSKPFNVYIKNELNNWLVDLADAIDCNWVKNAFESKLEKKQTMMEGCEARVAEMIEGLTIL